MAKSTTDIITFLDETTSTNQYLKDLSQLENLNEGSSVFTEYQKAGKGCGTNTWESEKGKNILFSSIFYPTFLPVDQPFIISEIISLSILEILQKETEETNPEAADKFSIKWPNDIYWEKKKIAGILIENTIAGNTICQSIIGAGININQEKFPEDIPDAISLKQIIHRESNTKILFIEILHNLHLNYLRLIKGEEKKLHQRYMDHLFRKKGLHPFYSEQEGNFEAYIKDIKPTGEIVLEKETGEKKSYFFKEVTFLI
ncbi:MAG: biotin--[acetyl-CoA-carboxylase] ligase [Candidatus Azobacteroides sp.]|nr:biotin--[acetyl-CoA-carboxylase] ligase [Candidatus Azobacteroides sp.]